jgi:hypothetical protein
LEPSEKDTISLLLFLSVHRTSWVPPQGEAFIFGFLFARKKIRKKPTQAQICVKAFLKADNRIETLRMIASELEPHEKAILKEWIDATN